MFKLLQFLKNFTTPLQVLYITHDLLDTGTIESDHNYLFLNDFHHSNARRLFA